jgi:hypothetical protein
MWMESCETGADSEKGSAGQCVPSPQSGQGVVSGADVSLASDLPPCYQCL